MLLPHPDSPVLIYLQIFCERVKKEFEGIPNVEIIVRDEGTSSRRACPPLFF
jgi:hypothetical protein